MEDMAEHAEQMYDHIIKIREKGKVVDKEKSKIYGDPGLSDIDATDIENFNGIDTTRTNWWVSTRELARFSLSSIRCLVLGYYRFF